MDAQTLGAVTTKPQNRQRLLADDILEALNRFSIPSPSQSFKSPPQLTSGMETPSSDTKSQTPQENSITNEWKKSPSFSNSYGEEWERLFVSCNGGILANLKEHALMGLLRNCRFRSLCWKIYLGVLSPDKSQWHAESRYWRDRYTNLQKEYLINPQGMNLRDDPLSQASSSMWNKYFLGNEVRREIMQDVVRTFPELEFFHGESVRAAMVNILFCFSQISPLRYKQGMHEILAPLIFVLHCDHLAYQHACEMSSVTESIRNLAGVVLDAKYLDHDAFAMFTKIMEEIWTWYVVKESPPTTPLDNILRTPFQRPQDMAAASCPVVDRLTRLHETLLRENDLELYLHLERVEIAPQMYGLRWLRLLFGREFPMQDLLVVWDALFGMQEDFILVDYVYIAMLMQIRDLLLQCDFADGLYLMMRYPPGVDVHYIVETALHLFQPTKYEKPKAQAYQSLYMGRPSPKRSNRSSTAASRRQAHRNRTTGLESLNKFRDDVMTKLSGLSFSPGTTRRIAGGDTDSLIQRPASVVGANQARPSTLMLGLTRPEISTERKVPSRSISDVNPPRRLLDSPSKTKLSSNSVGSSRQNTPVKVPPPASTTNPQLVDFIEILLPHERDAEAQTMQRYEDISNQCAQVIGRCVGELRELMKDLPVEDARTLEKTNASLCEVRDILQSSLALPAKGRGSSNSSLSNSPARSNGFPRSVSSSSLGSSLLGLSKSGGSPSINGGARAVELREFNSPVGSNDE